MLKDYIEEIALLPFPVKSCAGIVGAILCVMLIWVSLISYGLSKKAEKLEKANAELQTRVEAITKKAIVAEANAENEKSGADNLESQLPELETKGKSQNEKIKVQQNNSSSLRRSIDAIRRRKLPGANANTNTNAVTDDADFERELENRYRDSQANDH